MKKKKKNLSMNNYFDKDTKEINPISRVARIEDEKKLKKKIFKRHGAFFLKMLFKFGAFLDKSNNLVDILVKSYDKIKQLVMFLISLF